MAQNQSNNSGRHPIAKKLYALRYNLEALKPYSPERVEKGLVQVGEWLKKLPPENGEVSLDLKAFLRGADRGILDILGHVFEGLGEKLQEALKNPDLQKAHQEFKNPKAFSVDRIKAGFMLFKAMGLEQVEKKPALPQHQQVRDPKEEKEHCRRKLAAVLYNLKDLKGQSARVMRLLEGSPEVSKMLEADQPDLRAIKKWLWEADQLVLDTLLAFLKERSEEVEKLRGDKSFAQAFAALDDPKSPHVAGIRAGMDVFKKLASRKGPSLLEQLVVEEGDDEETYYLKGTSRRTKAKKPKHQNVGARREGKLVGREERRANSRRPDFLTEAEI